LGIYEELGVRPFINARAPYTRFGGSIMPDEVVAAMVEASRRFVNIYELQEQVGRAIAALTHNEAAYVSCGAASGLLLVTATCMVGTDEAQSGRLPNTEGMKNQVLLHRCDRGTEADVAIRSAGAAIVEIGGQDEATENDLVQAFNEKTAAVVTMAWDHPGKISLERMVALAHERGVPVIVDAADLVPPKENFWRFTRDHGADAVVISGGKGIRGPQTTGLVLATQTLIDGCAHHGSPNLRIGRSMKVGKEELVGAYAAVKRCVEQDETELQATWERQIHELIEQLADLPGVTTRKISSRRVNILIDVQTLGKSCQEIRDELLHAEPPILLGGGNAALGVEASTMQPGEVRIIAQQLRRILS
jgi:uncharacterized pyridoxal phosphate-dependent enzyme